MRLLGCLAVSLTCSGCMTWAKNPGEFRRNHPHTLGGSFEGNRGSVSYLHHAGKHLGLAVGFEKRRPTSERINVDQQTTSLNTENDPSAEERDFYQESQALTASSFFFPWEKSSFLVGLHVERRSGQIAYSEHTNDFSLDQSTTTWTGRLSPPAWASLSGFPRMPRMASPSWERLPQPGEFPVPNL